MLARHADGSIDTLESDFEQVCQPAAPQEAQLWYKKVGNTLHTLNKLASYSHCHPKCLTKYLSHKLSSTSYNSIVY